MIKLQTGSEGDESRKYIGQVTTIERNFKIKFPQLTEQPRHKRNSSEESPTDLKIPSVRAPLC